MFDKAEYWRRRHNTVKTKVPDGDKKKKDGSPRMKTVEVPRPLRGQVDISDPNIQPVEVDRRLTKKAVLKNSKRFRKLQAKHDNIQLEVANAKSS